MTASNARVRAGWIGFAAVACITVTACKEQHYCQDPPPVEGIPLSLGAPSRGRLQGGVRFTDSPSAVILPARHKARCLDWSTPRLVTALHVAGAHVQEAHRDSPPLGVGNLSRARGGPIPAYSSSHQSGRDADLAFYVVDERQRPVRVTDLVRVDGTGRARGLRFDVERNWTLVQSLLSQPDVDVQWIFVSQPLKEALLQQARQRGVEPLLLERAAQVVRQPSDAPPHDDHFHLRLHCSPLEKARGCRA